MAMNEKKLEDYGATIVRISQEEIAATAKKVHETVWPEVLKDVGTEWGQGILDSIIK